MKIKILQDEAPLYAQVETESAPLRVLQKGEMAETGKAVRARGLQWVEVVLADGTRGFLAGTTRAFSLITAAINQPKAALYGTAARGQPVAELKRGALVEFLDLLETGGETWIYVRDKDGRVGYLEGNTRILQKARVTKKTGLNNMLVGGGFFVLGLIFTLAAYASASRSGGTYYLCWGALLFGAIQFIQGLIQYLTAPEN